MMEIEAVNRKANAGLTTGIIGTVGAGLPILQSLLGGCGNNANTNKECSNDHSISRYDAAMMGQISKLEQENAILKILQCSPHLHPQLTGNAPGLRMRCSFP
mgnify:CR=1 FL=1